MSQRYFAITSPGLEAPLLTELRALGARKAVVVNGGVEFEGTNATFYRANYALRCANRVVLRVDDFRARDPIELYQKSRRYAWERLLGADNAVFVRGAARRSKLIHTGRIAKAVEDGLRDHFVDDLKKPAPAFAAEEPAADQLVLARLEDDRCQLSLDGSGELLYRRGWRIRIGAAPLRETIAAALLRLAEWKLDEPLFDPMCGSGTFVIEAAQRAANIAAGKGRSFALWRWKNFQPELWQEIVAAAAAEYREPEKQFFGRDIDHEMVVASRDNAAGAGVEAFCHFASGDAARIVPPTKDKGLIICNPPYGERMASEGIVDALVERVASNFEGWRMAALLPAAQRLPKSTLRFEERAHFKNGGIPVRFWVSI
ncbi:MAG: hypothetical protein H0U74_12770 [Bradymonadaceae bacterium]|nr:hypothetical protein [Lujinxingiaceae bacterium]